MKKFIIECIVNDLGIEEEITDNVIDKLSIILDLVRFVIGLIICFTISVLALVYGLKITDNYELKKELLLIGTFFAFASICSLCIIIRSIIILTNFKEIMDELHKPSET